jgi:hypothetical protein
LDKKTLDKNEIAALLESLCERPFAGDQEERPLAIEATAGRAGQALSGADAERSGSAAELASILSGTATPAQCHGFQEAAATSGAVRLEAQSALAFIDGIAQSPLAAPAHLVEQVLASTGGARSRWKPGIWSRLSGSLIGKQRGQVAAACAVMLVAGGLSWSVLRRPADLAPAGSVIQTIPKEAVPASAIGPAPALAPKAERAPLPTAPARAAPAAAQALVDPCTPPGVAKSDAQVASEAQLGAVRPEPRRGPRSAGLTAPDPDCAVDAGSRLVVNPADEGAAGRNQKADRSPIRAARPAASTGRLDRDPAAAAASAPAAAPYPGARPAPPAMGPSAVRPPR